VCRGDVTVQFVLMTPGCVHFPFAGCPFSQAADLTGLVPVAAADGLVVEMPTGSGGPYNIYSGGTGSGNYSFAIDPPGASGQKIIP
jgi:hypothetical protein